MRLRVNSRYNRVLAAPDAMYGARARPAPIHPRDRLARHRILRYPL